MPMRILDVGQCGFDGPEIARLLQERLGAKVESAPTADDAHRKLADHKYDLVMVNRIFAADGSSGLDLMEALVREASPTPVMLVSDRPDAQAAAIKKGAAPGFGKADLDDPRTFELIRNAVEPTKD